MSYFFFLSLTVLASSPLPQIRQTIRDAAFHSSLDPLLVEAVVSVESDFKTNARSHKGAMGLMQVMPATADECGIQNPYHATNNLMGACECLRRLVNQFQGNLKLALAAYNAGASNVDRHGGIPPFPETIDYVKKVLKKYRQLRQEQ